jgi:hypothetical protein
VLMVDWFMVVFCIWVLCGFGRGWLTVDGF